MTKICEECKATLLLAFGFVLRVKKNEEIWRKEWSRQTSDAVELSSDDDDVSSPQFNREGITHIKEELITEIKVEPSYMESEVSESIYPVQYAEPLVGNGLNTSATPVENNFSFSPSHVSTTTEPLISMFGPPINEECSIDQKVARINSIPGLTLDEKFKIFYGFNCDSCSNVNNFNTLSDLGNHFRAHHPGKLIKFKCCGFNIAKRIMEKHMKCHLGEFRRLTLEKHLEQLRKLHWCNKCGFSFNTALQLKRHDLHKHAITKSKERQRKLISELNKYKKMNFENIIRCSFCNESLSSFKQIEEHKIKHACEGRTPNDIKCHLCQKTFDKKALLNKHMATIHSEPSTSKAATRSSDGCPYCTFRSTNKNQLSQHIQSHYNF